MASRLRPLSRDVDRDENLTCRDPVTANHYNCCRWPVFSRLATNAPTHGSPPASRRGSRAPVAAVAWPLRRRRQRSAPGRARAGVRVQPALRAADCGVRAGGASLRRARGEG